MGAYRTAARFTCGVLIAGLLVACDAAGSDSDDDAGPDKAADALGAALASGEFADVEFSDETPEAVAKQYQKIVEGMGDVTPTVEVGEVSESDGTATAAAPVDLAGGRAGVVVRRRGHPAEGGRRLGRATGTRP